MEPNLSSHDIRQKFLDFFRSKGHEIVPSAPIVVKNDPTLLFTNAGMNQFKDVFLGNTPPQWSRVADTQKCLRVSGKHNDLEEVGVDTYHHTMFEMLGNWSFGNANHQPSPYFKEKAIAYSWELLTEVYRIPKEDIYVTIFEGDAREGLPMDEEALEFWKRHIDAERILKGNKKDNFWEMGDTGPCGPCTEIHVDCRPAAEKQRQPGKELVNADHPQVLEIWNVVFIQYNRKKDGSLERLPAGHIDTGMGFERLVRILQQKDSNYDTDVFSGTIQKIGELTGKSYAQSAALTDVAFRVIADHIRAIAFAITDGQLPSNTGAGYVIRRILRRAVRYAFSYLDRKEPLLHLLVPVIARQFREVFPELYAQQDFVARVIQEEEANFLRTLDSGLRRLQSLLAQKQNIDGKTAFELYDTYGFPLDLTRLIAGEQGLQVDEEGFDEEMHKQKTRSRAATAVDAGDWIVVHETPAHFCGYEHTNVETRVVKYRKTKSQGGEFYQIVLENTPFYAEGGGQVGDTGSLRFKSTEIPVLNTKKENDLIVHFTNELPDSIDGTVHAQIDIGRRRRIMAHHSATHLLHAALRNVLGNHVQQKGSLVAEESLRFDFSHFSKLSHEEIQQVEAMVNAKIRENVPVCVEVLPKEEALSRGAMALFGEKYEDEVRVVTMDHTYSIELCGGTHVARTGDLGLFKITGESAVGAGLRRIEAVSGSAAWQFLTDELGLLQQVKEQLKHPRDLTRAVGQLQEENSRLKKQLHQEELKGIRVMAEQLANEQSEEGVIGKVVEVSSVDALKKLTLLLQENAEGVVLAAAIQEKAQVCIAVSNNLITRGVDAPSLLRKVVAPLIRGGGGGQKNLATGGGQDTTRLQEVIEQVRAEILKA